MVLIGGAACNFMSIIVPNKSFLHWTLLANVKEIPNGLLVQICVPGIRFTPIPVNRVSLNFNLHVHVSGPRLACSSNHNYSARFLLSGSGLFLETSLQLLLNLSYMSKGFQEVAGNLSVI